MSDCGVREPARGLQGPRPWVTRETRQESLCWARGPDSQRSLSGRRKSGTGAEGRKIETQTLEDGAVDIAWWAELQVIWPGARWRRKDLTVFLPLPPRTRAHTHSCHPHRARETASQRRHSPQAPSLEQAGTEAGSL